MRLSRMTKYKIVNHRGSSGCQMSESFYPIGVDRFSSIPINQSNRCTQFSRTELLKCSCWKNNSRADQRCWERRGTLRHLCPSALSPAGNSSPVQPSLFTNVTQFHICTDTKKLVSQEQETMARSVSWLAAASAVMMDGILSTVAG